jgi:hypothetical protein
LASLNPSNGIGASAYFILKKADPILQTLKKALFHISRDICQHSQCYNWDVTFHLGHDRNSVLGTELSLSLRGRMTLEVGEIFYFIFHTLPQCHALKEVGDTYL